MKRPGTISLHATAHLFWCRQDLSHERWKVQRSISLAYEGTIKLQQLKKVTRCLILVIGALNDKPILPAQAGNLLAELLILLFQGLDAVHQHFSRVNTGLIANAASTRRFMVRKHEQWLGLDFRMLLQQCSHVIYHSACWACSQVCRCMQALISPNIQIGRAHV